MLFPQRVPFVIVYAGCVVFSKSKSYRLGASGVGVCLIHKIHRGVILSMRSAATVDFNVPSVKNIMDSPKNFQRKI